MNSRGGRMKMIAEGNRISSLPDDLAAKILSFVGAKQAVETGALSSRWRFMWTKVSCLNFSSEDFSTLCKFQKFFTYVLFYCGNQVEISLNLHGKVSQARVQTVIDQACSRKIKQLTFTFLYEKFVEFPLSLFSSRSLKHLTLVVGFDKRATIIPTSMWYLPNLTTLHLEGITLYDDNTKKCVGIFSEGTKNLKYLTIKRCLIKGISGLTICHTQLSNLTLKHSKYEYGVNVVAPQLKSLIIIDWDGELRISAPDLTSMLYKNKRCMLSLDVDSLPSLEKVGFCVSYQIRPYYGLRVDDARKVVDLLQKLSHVKYLTLSLEIVELLSSFLEAIAHQPSPFVNLRSLKIHPELYNDPQKTKLTMSSEIKSYLLDTSPGATFTMVTREEIRAVRDTKSAQNLIAKLKVLLHVEKAQIEKKEGGKRPQPCIEMPLAMWERERQVCDYWANLNEEINQGKKKTNDIISLVRRIKDLLMKLPSTNKAELQPHLSTLCTEADYIVSKILNHVKIGFETKASSLSVSFHQLFAAAQPSS